MKIGILSMQRVPNYGSFLQAHSLRNILVKLGHEVVFIDYKEEKPVVPFSEKKRFRYRLLDTPIVKFLNDWIKYNIIGKKLFDYKYRLVYLKQLNIGYRKRRDIVVDIAVIGSDEVFNCLQAGFNVGFSPMLFGQRINAKKVISYAASFGYTDMEGIKKYGMGDKLAEYLKSFACISVRDENSRKIVESLTGQITELNLDPVLVSDFSIPKIDIPYQDYVILYTYVSREYTEEDRKAILDFCKCNNKTLISIGSAQNWVSNQVEAAPLELLAYIKASDFIITDTFHGSVFSIKYNKPFATLIRENNKQKLMDLLHRLNKEDRIIDSFSELQNMYEKLVNYTDTNAVIAKEKEHTLKYLRKSLL